MHSAPYSGSQPASMTTEEACLLLPDFHRVTWWLSSATTAFRETFEGDPSWHASRTLPVAPLSIDHVVHGLSSPLYVSLQPIVN